MADAAAFFISYTSTDRAWAEWIAWQLESEGYTIVVQAWDFTAGRDWAHEMQHATSTAERVVAVLSAAYLRSAHGEAEWRVFYADDPSGARGLLLPVRVDKVDPPGLLKTRVYVDLVDQDATGARAVLLTAARGARAKPIREPDFPGAQRSTASATEAPRFPGELPPIWSVPYHPNPHFTGRDQLLIELKDRLNAPDMLVRRVVLTGLGGVGKTSVAVEHVYRRQADYDLVWWVNGERPASLLADLAALAGQLSLAPDAPVETQVAALRSWLERHKRWLLVLDNIDDPQVVVELLPRSSSGQVVLTSRAGVGWESLASVVSVDVLPPSDAADLLLGRAEENGSDAEAAATTLAAMLGGLPLALEQAGAYVASTGTVTLTGYAELFGTRALELLQRGQPLGYQHTVATTWSLTLQHLRETEAAAVDLLTLTAFLGPDNLPQPLLAAHADELQEPLASTARDPLALGDSVAALRRYSLVRVVADGLFVHRLLQTVVRAALDLNAKRLWTSAAVRLLRAGFPDDSMEVAAWPECDRLLPHVLMVADHAHRLDAELESRSWLLSRAGRYLGSRGRYRQAVTLHEEALAGYRQLLGSNHPTTLSSMEDLAETRWMIGDLQVARELHEQTLTGYRCLYGEDNPHTLHAMNNLAGTLSDLGELEAAREMHEQTLARYRRVRGQSYPDALWSMNNLAITLRRLGDLQGAHNLLAETLAARRRVLGEDHPHTTISMNDLAEIRLQLGDLQSARSLHEQTLTARRKVLGDDHPNTLTSLHNLAETLRGLGDLHGARDLHEQTLAGRIQVLGEDHPDTLTSMNNLAAVRRELGEA